MEKLGWNDYIYNKYSKKGIPRIHDGVRNWYDYDEVVEWVKANHVVTYDEVYKKQI